MSEQGCTPFTIYQAQFALYQTSADDLVIGEAIFLGGQAERVICEGALTPRALQYQGGKATGVRHVDEEHLIEITNYVLHQVLSGGAARLGSPGVRRNQRLALALVWYDPEARHALGGYGVWWKRSYFGVTAQPARVEAVAGNGNEPKASAMQTMRLRAESMREKAGLGEPDLQVVQDGEVRYIDGAETLALYEYDGDERTFTAVDPALLTGRASIDLDTPGQIDITIGDVLCLRATVDEGLQADDFIGNSGTFSDVEPRLEFWADGRRLATLAAGGLLICPDFTEAATDPGDARAMSFRNGADWIFTIGGACAARDFFDGL